MLWNSCPWQDISSLHQYAADADCFDNEVKNNHFKNSRIGIYITDACERNTITNNTIEEHSRGIDLGALANYNNFYNNRFIDNAKHVIEETGTNNWNSTHIGNYWDDYGDLGGNDMNDDGIGDQLYYIIDKNEDIVNQDYFPIWDDGHDGIKFHVDDSGDNGFIKT